MKKLFSALLIIGILSGASGSHAAYPTTTEHHKLYPYTSIMASPYSGDSTGTVDCSAAIESIKANQSNTGTIYIPKGTFRIGTNLSIPAGMTLEFASAAYLIIDAGVTLTLPGPVVSPEGQSCFIGAGVLSLGTSFPSTDTTKILQPGTWAVTTNTTIPSNIVLRPRKGAILTVATGVTLTINGILDAGPHQIFSCTGTGKVAFAAGVTSKILPEWFYSGSGSYHTAFQSAIDACPAAYFPAGSAVIQLNPGKTYSFDAGITIPYTKRISIKGDDGYTSQLLMSASFSPTDVLIHYTGASGQRPAGINVSGFLIKGNDDVAIDGIGLQIDYGNDIYIDIFANYIRNHAIRLEYCWDAKMSPRTYACGWNTGTVDNAAVYVGSPVSGSDNFNGIQILPGTRIERSYGTSLEINTGSNVQVFGKIHGRAYTDANSGNVGSLVKIHSATLVNLSACELDQFRYLFVANGITPITKLGAVNITGVSIVTLNGNIFVSVGDETNTTDYATWMVNFDPTNSTSRLILTGNNFREPVAGPVRANCPYLNIGTNAGPESISLTGNRFATPSMAYIPTAVTGLALNGQTYVLPIYGTIAAPAPSTTYYVGLGGIIQTSTSYQQLIAPAKGFVRYVKINSNCTVGTSASSTELYLTHINPAPDVDYTIATDLLTNAVDATRGKYWPLDTIAGLLPCYLQAGESLLIKVVTPAWGGGAANPTNWVISGYVVIQEP